MVALISASSDDHVYIWSWPTLTTVTLDLEPAHQSLQRVEVQIPTLATSVTFFVNSDPWLQLSNPTAATSVTNFLGLHRTLLLVVCPKDNKSEIQFLALMLLQYSIQSTPIHKVPMQVYTMLCL